MTYVNELRIRKKMTNGGRLACCFAWIVASGLIASESSSRDSTSREEQKSFDVSRSVVLQGDAARELVESTALRGYMG
jgi:hypothetical protein